MRWSLQTDVSVLIRLLAASRNANIPRSVATFVTARSMTLLPRPGRPDLDGIVAHRKKSRAQAFAATSSMKWRCSWRPH